METVNVKIDRSRVSPTLEITTNANCTMECVHCPQSSFRNAYKGPTYLGLNDFRNMLQNVPDYVTINFSGFSEPFLNKDCTDMIEYAKQKGHRVALFTTLVGLDINQVTSLKGNVDSICLHLPDNIDNAHIPPTHQHMDTLYHTLHTLKIDGFSVMNENFHSNGRAGLCNGTPKIHFRGWFNCLSLTYPDFVLLPNGDIVLCCMDFGLKHRLGNLHSQTYQDIAAGQEFQRIRRNQRQFDGDVLCRNCRNATTYKKHLLKGAARLGVRIFGL